MPVPASAEPLAGTPDAGAEPEPVTTVGPGAPAAGTRRMLRRRRPGPEKDEDAPPAREPLFAPARRPGRRVTRIVRHVQLWSVFKVALLAGLVFYVIFLLAVGLGWSLANATGQVHHIEQFMRQIGFDNWSFNGPALFRAAALLGAIGLTVGSVLVTLAAAIVNLISEATGGIRFTVIEVDEADDEVDPDDPESVLSFDA